MLTFTSPLLRLCIAEVEVESTSGCFYPLEAHALLVAPMSFELFSSFSPLFLPKYSTPSYSLLLYGEREPRHRIQQGRPPRGAFSTLLIKERAQELSSKKSAKSSAFCAGKLFKLAHFVSLTVCVCEMWMRISMCSVRRVAFYAKESLPAERWERRRGEVFRRGRRQT